MENKAYVFDIEANTFELDKLERVHCIVVFDVDTEDEYVYTDDASYNPDGTIVDGLGQLAAASMLIGHNILRFDVPALEKLYNFKYDGIQLDTLLLSQLLNPDRQKPFLYTGKAGPHSIEVWGARLGKDPKIQLESFDKLTPELLKRCREDVRTNWAVYKELYKEAL